MNRLILISLLLIAGLSGVRTVPGVVDIVKDIIASDEPAQAPAQEPAMDASMAAKGGKGGSALYGYVDQANIQFDVVDNQLGQLTDIISKDLRDLFDKEDLSSDDLEQALESLEKAKELRKAMCKQMKTTVKSLKKSIKKATG